MKKYTGYVVGGVIILAFVLYFFLSGQNGAVVAGAPTTGTTPPVTNTTSQTSGTPAGTPPTPSQPQAAAYKDGTYTGPVTDAVYGQLQIAVTISGGQITNVTWPVYPSDSGHTMQVSQSALPQLKQEAIASQSANVDIVSGATQTSQAFQQSLATALAMAK